MSTIPVCLYIVRAPSEAPAIDATLSRNYLVVLRPSVSPSQIHTHTLSLHLYCSLYCYITHWLHSLHVHTVTCSSGTWSLTFYASCGLWPLILVVMHYSFSSLLLACIFSFSVFGTRKETKTHTQLEFALLCQVAMQVRSACNFASVGNYLNVVI